MSAELTMDIAGQEHIATHIPPSSDTSAELTIVNEIQDALKTNRLDLPTLPEIAIKIQNLIDNPNVSADELVNLLSSDPVISMHIIRAANSAALSNGQPARELRGAISRLGYRMLRSMVINITLTKLFQAHSPLIDRKLKGLWKHSREVAANSYVLAQQQKHLRPEQAMLAGLIHDIGTLPLYLYADRHQSRLDQDSLLDQTTLEELIRKFSVSIGTRLLHNWNFPDELIDVVATHDNQQRNSNSNLADYVDVVTMANLQMPGTAKFVAWENIAAAERLGYCVADCQNFLSDHADQLAAVRGMLEGGATRH